MERCPSLAFYVHGLLSLALGEGGQSVGLLHEALQATPETMHEWWLKYRPRPG